MLIHSSVITCGSPEPTDIKGELIRSLPMIRHRPSSVSHTWRAYTYFTHVPSFARRPSVIFKRLEDAFGTRERKFIFINSPGYMYMTKKATTQIRRSFKK